MRRSLGGAVVLLALVTACGDDETTTSTSSGSGGASTTSSTSTTSSAGGEVGSGGAGGTTSTGGMEPFALTSTAFAEGETVPTVHECGPQQGPGDNVSPPLAWTEGPSGTLSYAIVMRDLDFNNLVHWVIYDIPPSTLALPEDIPASYQPPDPAGSKQALLQGVVYGYFGPCSPNSVNTYQWTVHALPVDTLPGVDMNTSENEIATAVEGASMASASLSGES